MVVKVFLLKFPVSLGSSTNLVCFRLVQRLCNDYRYLID